MDFRVLREFRNFASSNETLVSNMLKIKKLYIFMLQTFLPQFLMTFFICLFIVMMQFLWKYIDDLVGKGLSIDVVAELFFYAALTLVPLALPLAILLASLMTFGNLGEHVELTALKSSGISLLKVMAPLMVLISGISVGAFFFQDKVLPESQVKMWTLLFSMRQKSPTLDIPEGTVYTQIPGFNLYVKHKDKENDMLYNLLIYDVSGGSGSPRIVAADSGHLSFTDDKRHLVLNLYQGNWYEDMRANGSMGMGGNLYRREAFHDKEIVILYDNNFTRMDDDAMRQQYVGKNITQLKQTIDSVRQHLDSIGNSIAREMQAAPVVGMPTRHLVVRDNATQSFELTSEVAMPAPLNVDSLLAALTPTERSDLYQQALMRVQNTKQDYMFKGYNVQDDNFTIRRHQIEMHKKFTLSLACLIFFLIGVPLGAIVRKGGLGTPIVISVVMYLIYYIIDHTGYKLARDGRWPVAEGIWLSSAVLLPLGIFLTKKAIDDSAVFNPDAYMNFLRRITGVQQVRKLSMKELVMNEVRPEEAVEKITSLQEFCKDFNNRYQEPQSYLDYWRYGYDKALLRNLSVKVEEVVDYLSNSREQMVINKTMDYPIVRQLLLYHPTNYPQVGTDIAALFPIGLPGYWMGKRMQKCLKADVAKMMAVSDQLIAIFKGEYTREMEYNSLVN